MRSMNEFQPIHSSGEWHVPTNDPYMNNYGANMDKENFSWGDFTSWAGDVFSDGKEAVQKAADATVEQTKKLSEQFKESAEK